MSGEPWHFASAKPGKPFAAPPAVTRDQRAGICVRRSAIAKITTNFQIRNTAKNCKVDKK